MGEDWGGDLRRVKEGKRRECAPSERKSPPFAERREGWGTLKFKGEAGLEEEPKTHTQRRRVGHPAKRDPRAQTGVSVPQEKPKTQVKNRTWGTLRIGWGLVRVGRGRRRRAGPRLCGLFRRGRGLAEWLRWPFAPGDRLREGSLSPLGCH